MEEVAHPPLVSVMMPSYNAEDHVAEAIESVIAQTYPHWELVFVDDGSTDATADIVRAFADRDERIKYVRIPHSGRGEARKRCIDLCRGKYVAVCDSDDISLPERFEKQVRFLEDNPEIGVVGAQIRSFSADAVLEKSVLVSWPVGSEEIAQAFLAKKMKLPHPVSMIRSSLFETLGGYNIKLHRAQDYELFARFSQQGVKFHNLTDMLLFYRQKTLLPPLDYFIESGLYGHYANVLLRGKELDLDSRITRVCNIFQKAYFIVKYHTYVKLKYSLLYHGKA